MLYIEAQIVLHVSTNREEWLMSEAAHDIKGLNDAIYRDGYVAVPGAMPIEWADGLNSDLEREYERAMDEQGCAPRGTNRYYFEPYAELTLAL